MCAWFARITINYFVSIDNRSIQKKAIRASKSSCVFVECCNRSGADQLHQTHSGGLSNLHQLLPSGQHSRPCWRVRRSSHGGHFFGFLGSYGMQIWSETYFPVLAWMGSDVSKQVMLANLFNTLSEGSWKGCGSILRKNFENGNSNRRSMFSKEQ